MDEEWTRSVIETRMYNEVNQWDDNQPPFEKKYYTDILQYVNRRMLCKYQSQFKDVIHVYILTFSDELRSHVLRLDNDTLNEVIS